MDITKIEITLAEDCHRPLLAYCKIVLGGKFVVYNLKLIGGEKKGFVTMPNRYLTGHCQKCRCRNSLQAHYCNRCGIELDDRFHRPDHADLRRDIFHPINALSREEIEGEIFSAYEEAIFSAYREEKFSQK